jgi:hypothetical protein
MPRRNPSQKAKMRKAESQTRQPPIRVDRVASSPLRVRPRVRPRRPESSRRRHSNAALGVTLHANIISPEDRAALTNLWGEAGAWAADIWKWLNADHFGGQLRYHGIVFGLTPHGHRLAHTYPSGRITLHPALLDPRGDAWEQEYKLGARHAEDVLLHEMVHAWLFDTTPDHASDEGGHNIDEWCTEIVRITPGLGLPPVKAAPVKPRRTDGAVRRMLLDGHLSRADIAHWPHSLRPAGYYDREGRIPVPI